MENKRKMLAKAALLHDIGKVCYRVEAIGNHSLAGVEYLKKYLVTGEETKIILSCVLNHHAAQLKKAVVSDDSLCYLVYEADNIAAGSDRRLNEGGEAGFNSKACLESVFNLLGEDSAEKGRLLLKEFNPQKGINYPISGTKVEASAGVYADILAVFDSNFQRGSLSAMEPNELLKILEGALTFVPSSTAVGEVCDISLFDHQKITAAIACALQVYFEENDISDYKAYCFGAKNQEFRETSTFMLVSGDISGIQEFIYAIPSAGALKSLRGRSFYLELLLENIVDELLEALSLSRANLIYTGGGHFYLLVANTEQTKDIIDDFQKKLDKWFLDNYGTRLYMALAYDECSPNELMSSGSKAQSGASQVFRRLSSKLSIKKLSRYDSESLEDLFEHTSTLNKNINGERECGICHISSRKLERYAAPGSELPVCASCNNMYKLGSMVLKNELAIVVSNEESENSVEIFGYLSKLYLYPLEVKETDLFAKEHDTKRIYVKNDFLTGNTLATQLWVGDYITKNACGQAADFAELAAMSGGSDSGINRLGVLRADVDSLGAVFEAGFYKEHLQDHSRYATLSRYASLSRQLSLFFKHYINKVCAGKLTGLDKKEVLPFRLFDTEKSNDRKVDIVYSGGDDVFMVGAWDDLLEFAVDFRRALTRFTGDKLTFSAGLALYNAAFPVSQMARMTGFLEEQAKGNKGKDSIALFGINHEIGSNKCEVSCQHTFHWQEFEEKVCGEKLAFLKNNFNVSGKNDDKKILVGKTLLYRMLGLLSEEDQQDGRFNLARFAYMLARMEPGHKASEQQKQCYGNIKDKLYLWVKNPQERKQLVTAINLLVYKLRETNKGE